MAETRGIRNNNPFNIKRSSSKWIGKVPHSKSTDKTYEQFTCFDYGLRAGVILLRNYIKRGYNTYRKIITRFAPSSENNVSSYLKFICHCMDYNPDAVFEYKSDYFYNLVKSICYFESHYVLSDIVLKSILHKFHL